VSPITVWLPDPGWVEAMGGLPEPMTADIWTGGEELPDSAGEVEIVVIPFGVPGTRLAVLGKLPQLRLVQLMSAGAERVIPHVPAGVTPGLLLTPHVAGVSTQTISRARAIVWDQLARYAAGRPLRNVVGERGY
jgi:phosphoglycerate dehydrogenase-like enzyme